MPVRFAVDITGPSWSKSRTDGSLTGRARSHAPNRQNAVHAAGAGESTGTPRVEFQAQERQGSAKHDWALPHSAGSVPRLPLQVSRAQVGASLSDRTRLRHPDTTITVGRSSTFSQTQICHLPSLYFVVQAQGVWSTRAVEASRQCDSALDARLLGIFRAMNIFTTDHPLAQKPFRLSQRARRWLICSVAAYPVYLLLLGPFWALDGRGALNFIPEGVRQICYAPTYPVWCVPHLRGKYADYFDWWYRDTSAADRETGWD